MKCPHAARHRAFEQRPASDGVVAIIFERIDDRFGHDDRSGEVHDGAHIMGA